MQAMAEIRTVMFSIPYWGRQSQTFSGNVEFKVNQLRRPDNNETTKLLCGIKSKFFGTKTGKPHKFVT
ncbi:MAG: hypothetical protein ACI87E_004516 [Mariniblastus sp.]|jgi:hypothetical protein